MSFLFILTAEGGQAQALPFQGRERLTEFLLYLDRNGKTTADELSLFFATFVLLQFWNMFNVRCLDSKHSAFTGFINNLSFVAIANIILVGQILIVQFGGSLFCTYCSSISK